MAAIAAVNIANRALQRLGASYISSLTQTTPNAASMNNAYDIVRRRLLRVYAWGFAKSRASVPALSVVDPIAQLNQYPLPNDFIRLLRDLGPELPHQRHDWVIENVANVGPCILTSDDSPLQFRYIYDAQTPSQFDPLFVEALACTLAYECCEEITGSTTKRNLLGQDMRQILQEARFTNAIEKDADVPLQDDWLIAMQAGSVGPDVNTGRL